MKITPTFLVILLPLLFTLDSKADLDGYDASVSLSVGKMNARYICTGALINSKTVVTAAHCLVGALNVRVGRGSSVNQTRAWTEADDWKPHPEYTGNNFQSVDLAVIHLKNELKVSPYFELTNFTDGIVSGELMRVGFGGRNMNEPMKKGENYSDNVRTLVTGMEPKFGSTGIYYSYEDKFGFEGDSGGPIFVRRNGNFLLIGVHTGRAMDMQNHLLNTSNLIPLTPARISWIKNAFR